MSAIQAPKTVGPNLASLTIREQAQLAWDRQAAEEKRQAERAATNLARSIFGINNPVFVDYVDADYMRRHRFQPKHVVVFEVEGMFFNYQAATREEPEQMVVVDECPHCEAHNPRLLGKVRTLADLGRVFSFDWSEIQCLDCKGEKE